MKQLLTLIIALLGMAQAYADTPRLVNGDGSALTNLCIDAAESNASFKRLAKFYGFQGMNEADLVCNGLSLKDFKERYAKVEKTTTVLSFSRNDMSPSTELCFAAVTGADNYETLKASFNTKTDQDVSTVTCNGMPLDRFVRRYGVDAFLSKS